MADVHRLPGPIALVWEWQMSAACRDLDIAVFFHPEAERGASAVNRDRTAKSVCAGCPVIQACRRHALSVREPYGVWGGLSTGERNLLLGQGQQRQPDPARSPPATSTEGCHRA